MLSQYGVCNKKHNVPKRKTIETIQRFTPAPTKHKSLKMQWLAPHLLVLCPIPGGRLQRCILLLQFQPRFFTAARCLPASPAYTTPSPLEVNSTPADHCLLSTDEVPGTVTGAQRVRVWALNPVVCFVYNKEQQKK